MHQLVRRTKEEYEVAIKMYKKTRDPYWLGRISLAKELLNIVSKEYSNINCLTCNVSYRDCKQCLLISRKISV